MNNLELPLNLSFICNIHGEIARGEALEWGKLRTGKVGISGTNYIPPIPNSEMVQQEIKDILKIEQPTQRAINLMFWGMKSQLFWDGNKRTFMLVANKIMIENGCGIISVPTEMIEQFNEVLSDYYNNNTIENAINFVYENCIDGIDFQKTKEVEEEQLEDENEI